MTKFGVSNTIQKSIDIFISNLEHVIYNNDLSRMLFYILTCIKFDIYENI